MLNTIVRSGEVLDLFSPERPEWGVTEMAEHLKLPKSNTHEILTSLAEINLLQRTEKSRYRLGWRLFSMARHVVDSSGIQKAAQPVMAGLAERLGETTHLAVWDGSRLVFAARSLAAGGLNQPHAAPGCYLAAHCTASGKILMSQLQWDEVVRRTTQNGIVRRTERSISDLSRLRAELRAAQETNVSYNVEETDSGVCSAATPVRDANGTVVAALGVSVPKERFPRLKNGGTALLVQAGERISKALASQSRMRSTA